MAVSAEQPFGAISVGDRIPAIVLESSGDYYVVENVSHVITHGREASRPGYPPAELHRIMVQLSPTPRSLV